MPYLYDTSRGRLRTAMCVAHTVLPNVLASPEFWLFFLLHLAVFFSYRLGMFRPANFGEQDIYLHWRSVKVVTAMTTFFEVFYSNQCYARYLNLYRSTKGIFDDAHAFAQLVRTQVGAKSRVYARLSVRYMMAALSLQVAEMRGGVSEAHIDEVCAMGLIRPKEAESLRFLKPGHRSPIVLNWAQQVACSGCTKVGAPNNIQSVLCQTLLRMESQQQDILDTLALPVPFQYFHLLSIMIIMNLALWAYSMGCTDSIFSPVVFFFASLIFIGMMELSSELSDPFGADEVDFPVAVWLGECLDLVSNLVEHRYPGGQDGLEMAADSEPPLPNSAYEAPFTRQARLWSEGDYGRTPRTDDRQAALVAKAAAVEDGAVDRRGYAQLREEGRYSSLKAPSDPSKQMGKDSSRTLMGYGQAGP